MGARIAGRKKTGPRARTVRIDTPMTIYQASEQKAQLVEAARAAAEVVELDLGAVTEMDTAGFQLLVLAKAEAERRGHGLRIVAESRAVREVLDFYNMRSCFEAPPADAGNGVRRHQEA